MQPLRPWQLEPTLRALFRVVLAFSGAILLMAVLARAVGAGAQSLGVSQIAVGVFHLATLWVVQQLLRDHGMTWREAFGLRSPRALRTMGLAALLTLPAGVITLGLHEASLWTFSTFGVRPDTQAAVAAVSAAASPWERMVLFVFAVITAPVVEELLFRGILWPLARARGYRVWGCVVVSLLFAAFHQNSAVLVPLWFLGAFWAWLYDYTGDLTAPILSHALFNLVNFAWLVMAPPPSTP